MNATRYLPFVGRLLIGVPFAMSGLSKLAAYGPTTQMIGAAGLPAPPLAFAVAVAVELGGGLLLIAGFQTRRRRDCGRSFAWRPQCRFIATSPTKINDPLPQKHHDRGWTAPDRGLRCGRDQR